MALGRDFPEFVVKKVDSNQAFLDYTKTFVNVSGPDALSGMHWNQRVRVFIKGDVKNYFKNHMRYLMRLMRLMSDDLDEDLEDEILEGIGNTSPYKVGMVIVKENYAEVGDSLQPIFLTVMIKHEKGYAPKSGDWEYIKLDAQGELIQKGKGSDKVVMADCHACHMNLEMQDFTFASLFNGSLTTEKFQGLLKTLNRVEH